MKDPNAHISFKEARKTWYDPESMRPLADTYWRFVLLLAFVVVVSAFVYGGTNLMRVLDEFNEPPPVQASNPLVVLDRGKLEAMLTIFENRKTQFDTLQAASSTPAKSAASAR